MNGMLTTELFFDPQRIAQVVDNLVGNAIKFSPSIKIYISARVQQDNMVLRERQGPGLSQNDKTKLSGDFQTLSAANKWRKDTGLEWQ